MQYNRCRSSQRFDKRISLFYIFFIWFNILLAFFYSEVSCSIIVSPTYARTSMTSSWTLESLDQLDYNLGKCDENAIHFHEDQKLPVPAKVVVETYPATDTNFSERKKMGVQQQRMIYILTNGGKQSSACLLNTEKPPCVLVSEAVRVLQNEWTGHLWGSGRGGSGLEISLCWPPNRIRYVTWHLYLRL